MDGVTLGAGDLAGTGVYAARDFAAGEVVVEYQLQPLTAEEYDSLPAGEELFVHSYAGRRYLYPSPARFVNHSDDPSCWQDFERGCDIARRPIAAGEPITIDARQETARELDTFVRALMDALEARSSDDLALLLSESVSLWSSGRQLLGRHSVINELVGRGVLQLTDIDWIVGTGRWEALCSARSGGVDEHVTMLLKVLAGNWQLIYLHVG